MLYLLVKYLVRSGLFFFFRKVVFSNKELLKRSGPLLLACNHPNSFLDALIIGAYFKRPVHFLARGDAFKNPLAARILTALKAIPIYRLKEGKEYLALNDVTFEKCTTILKNGGIVLIFTEGLCLNQWQLRPLKKGAARIALNIWRETAMQQNFELLPISLNYSSFTGINKNVLVHFGQPVSYQQIDSTLPESEQLLLINKLLSKELEKGILIESGQPSLVQYLLANFASKAVKPEMVLPYLKSVFMKIRISPASGALVKLHGDRRLTFGNNQLIISLFFILIAGIPSLPGFVIHLPFYLPIKRFIKNKTIGTVFYHSALFSVLIITYPLYIFVVSFMLTWLIPVLPYWLCVFALPLSAAISIFFNDQLLSVINFFRLTHSERGTLNNLMIL